MKAGAQLVISDGTDTITSSDDAVHSNDTVQIDGGTLKLSTGDDAIHADNALTTNGGTIDVTASYEGLESNAITLNAATINITSSDDGINASDGSGEADDPGAGSASNSTMVITGGAITVDAGGDGLDSNGAMTISGGTIVVNGPTDSGNGALDTGGTLRISGGTLFAAGSSGMAESPDTDSSQAWLQSELTASAGQSVTISTTDGTQIASYTVAKATGNIVFSSSAISAGSSYLVSVNGGSATTVTANQSTGTTMGGAMGAPGPR
ncbi:carbohydrate-binding domain-containing protein [Propionibacterium freudenreichii]|uniref:carbohydrate-binding domain-containing protein n=1 Tax=Propionibacterium freudenreichii TaxID=1744 RepID=UPI000DEF063C